MDAFNGWLGTIHDISKYNDRLFVTGFSGACRYAELHDLGVTAICNLTDDPLPHDEAGFSSMTLGQLDCDDIPTERLEQFLAWMDEQWAAGHKILVHCHAGISRAPSFTIAWLLHREGANSDTDLKGRWSYYQDRLGLVRPVIDPHWRLKQSILWYFECRS